MNFLAPKTATLAAVATAVLAWTATVPAYAGITDYEFQLVTGEVKKGSNAMVEVRLFNVKTKKAVPDAVIFAKRIDMAPDGMETMTAPIELVPSAEPGVYRFKTKLIMEGRWQLSLGAKVQGETGSLENKLVVKVTP